MGLTTFPCGGALLELVDDWFLHDVDCVSDDVAAVTDGAATVILLVVVLLEAAGFIARTAIRATVATSTTTRATTARPAMAADACLLVSMLPGVERRGPRYDDLGNCYVLHPKPSIPSSGSWP